MGDIQLLEKKPALWKIAVLCVVSGFLNTSLHFFINGVGGIPLYLDTLFTVAVCFSVGLLPALITALLSLVFTSLLYMYLFTGLKSMDFETARWTFLFIFCAFSEVLLVFSFRKKIMPLDAAFRKKPSLYAFVSLIPLLLLIAVLACIVVSVTGGIIDYILTLLSAPKAVNPEDSFKLGLLRNNVPVLVSCILSRIPINIVDRFIVIFGGYGVSLLYRKWIYIHKAH